MSLGVARQPGEWAALAASLELWGEVADRSGSGLLAFDRELSLAYWSAGMERLTGLDRRSVLGMRADEFPGAGEACRRALAGEPTELRSCVLPSPPSSEDPKE